MHLSIEENYCLWTWLKISFWLIEALVFVGIDGGAVHIASSAFSC